MRIETSAPVVKKILFLITLLFIPIYFTLAQDNNLGERLRGKILLQVEANGEGWYVNPDNAKRYYLGRPADAFNIMRELGLGISNKDFDSFNGYAPARLLGKILLKVEDNGKAYYVNPDNLKMHYLGRPEDAFQIMRELGLGISNKDLGGIEVSSPVFESIDKKENNEIEQNASNSKIGQSDNFNLDDGCGHNIDMSIVDYGYNIVVDKDGNEIKPQGKPFQEGYALIESNKYVDDYNSREYAQIFVYMGNIRDALMCDIDSINNDDWKALTEILEANDIKTTQSLSGTPKEQYYSSSGIYEHLIADGEDFHPMMKYLEEAELELKCLAFKDFNFVNPEGKNHCQIHNLDEGSGLILP